MLKCRLTFKDVCFLDVLAGESRASCFPCDVLRVFFKAAQKQTQHVNVEFKKHDALHDTNLSLIIVTFRRRSTIEWLSLCLFRLKFLKE
jgi:hypothetical protein